METAGEIVFYVAMGVALGHLVLNWVGPAFHGSPLAGVLTLATLMLPALAAVRSHREYKRLAMRSKKMEADLKELKGRFRLLTPSRLETLLRETEQLMLKETLDWLALMKFAELHKAV